MKRQDCRREWREIEQLNAMRNHVTSEMTYVAHRISDDEEKWLGTARYLLEHDRDLVMRCLGTAYIAMKDEEPDDDNWDQYLAGYAALVAYLLTRLEEGNSIIIMYLVDGVDNYNIVTASLADRLAVEGTVSIMKQCFDSKFKM